MATIARGGVLALAIATALAGPAAAETPACALIQRSEAAAVLGSPLKLDEGSEKKGYSDCAWIRAGKVVGLLYWTPEEFADGKVSAADRYAARAGALSRKTGLISEPDGIAEKARLLDESSPGIVAYTVVILRNGAVAELSARGVTKAETLDLLRIAVDRIPAEKPRETAPPAEPVPEPPAASEPPAEAAPTPPSAEPAAPPAEPEPVQPEPARPEARPEPPPAETAPPEPEPARPAPKKAQGPSPACKLLSSADFKDLAPGEVAMRDPGPGQDGESACSWRAGGMAMFVRLSLLERQALPEGQEPAAYFADLEKTATANGARLMAGVGERAILETSGEGDGAMLSVSILARGRIVFLNLTGVPEAAAIKLATAAAGRM